MTDIKDGRFRSLRWYYGRVSEYPVECMDLLAFGPLGPDGKFQKRPKEQQQ